MENLNLIFEKFNQFRKRNKHTDVNICVDGIPFLCHRMLLAASCDYFDKLFSSNFRDSNQETIHLMEVDPVAFSEILEFIYTGKINITGENVSRVLRISNFLGIQYIEGKCANYIYNNFDCNFYPEICNIFERLPKDITEMKFVEKLLPYFEQLVKMDFFLDTPINVMRIILTVLRQKNSSLLKSSEVFYAMLKWYRKNSEERCDFFANVIRRNFYDLPCSSEMLARLVTDNFLSNTEEELEQDSENSTAVGLNLENIKSENLLLYVRATDNENNKRGILEVELDANGKWMKSANKMVCPSVDYLKTVFACNKQYFLTYKCGENQFWSNFYDKKSWLKCPPVTFLTYTLAEILDENIYLCGLPVSTAVSGECQFLHYNIEIDKWFPLQLDPQFPLKNAKIVPFNNTLLCAFNHYKTSLFDRRTHMWYTVGNYSVDGYVAACVNNGCIYLSGVGSDIESRKENIGSTFRGTGSYQMRRKPPQFTSLLINPCLSALSKINVTESVFLDKKNTEHVLVPYENRCWSIYRNLQAEIFDPKENLWMSMLPVSENVKLRTDTYKVQELYDAVVSEVSVTPELYDANAHME